MQYVFVWPWLSSRCNMNSFYAASLNTAVHFVIHVLSRCSTSNKTHTDTPTPKCLFFPSWCKNCQFLYFSSLFDFSYYIFWSWIFHTCSVSVAFSTSSWLQTCEQTTSNRNKNVSVRCYTLSTCHSSPRWTWAQMRLNSLARPVKPPLRVNCLFTVLFKRLW